MRSDTTFSPSFGNRPHELVGRNDVVQQLVDGLRTWPGNRERAAVILGQRGSGKTVLLWELADRAREMGYVVANPTTATEGMLDRIIEKIQRDGERYVPFGHAKLSGGSIGALGFSAGLQFTRETLETKSFHYKLSMLCERLGVQGHGVLVLIDEIQANSPDIRQLVASYQELVGERCDIAIVMAGLPAAVSGTLNDHVLTFLNRATKISLPPLALFDIDAYYANAFAEMGVDFAPKLRRQAAAATEGSPYLMQLIGHYLTLYAFEGVIDADVMQTAIDAAREDFQRDVCKTTLAALSQVDIRFLSAMSRDDDVSSIGDIAERMGEKPDYAQKYRKRLIDAGVIESAGRGLLRFAVPYVREYLRDGRGHISYTVR